MELKHNTSENNDPTAPSRKKDHIELAFKSRIEQGMLDPRFYYEPFLSEHPDHSPKATIQFLNQEMSHPIWVSSMTGGTELAGKINKNLAQACGDYGLGMGLGSCRGLLYDDKYLSDYQLRKYIGDQPLYANLGIAQIETLIDAGELSRISALLSKLETNGLIIHVNPLQEWLQPEGDTIKRSPLKSIEQILDTLDISLIVKEVGQGFGYHSMKALIKLPLDAIEFSAGGGTNFSKLELMRSDCEQQELYSKVSMLGHSAEEMVGFYNEAIVELGAEAKCKNVIISGGIRDFLDGYYLMNKINCTAIYGQASSMLKHAKENYESLSHYIESQIAGLQLAQSYLKLR